MYNGEKAYYELRKTNFSYTCYIQGEYMFRAIERHILVNDSMSHSLLRLAIRPLYYIYFRTLDDIIVLIKESDVIQKPKELIVWLKRHRKMIDTIFKELDIMDNYYTQYNFETSLEFMKSKVVEPLKELNLTDSEIIRVLLEEDG